MESGSSKVSAESSLDFGFAFNDVKFSDRTLRVEIMPESTGSKPKPIDSLAHWALTRKRKRRCSDKDSNVHETVQRTKKLSSTDNPATQVKTIHISTPILAAKSPFFYKLFSNGMSESNEQHVTLRIQESEEAAFMDLLKFMYTNTLLSTTPSALLNVLMAADKYEVASCMKYCLQLLPKSPMTCESALLYLDLSSTILMDDAVQPLTDVAKEFLVAHFKDIKFQEEMLNLPLAGIEVVLSSDDLQVDSEDVVYDFVMNWARRHYPRLQKRREILNSHLLPLIRFQFMSCYKLKELQECKDITIKRSSELVFDALSLQIPHQQLSLVSHEKERAYKYRPVKITRFDSPHEECLVYLDLKREECARILPSGQIYSRNFHFGGQDFYLMVNHVKDKQDSSKRIFGFFLGMHKDTSVVSFVVECVFFSRTKPSDEFVAKKLYDYNFARGTPKGSNNLFGVPWDTFIADDSPYFINGVLHLMAMLKMKKQE